MFGLMVAVVTVYPILSQDIQAVGGAPTPDSGPDSGFSTNSTDSAASSLETTSVDNYTFSTPSATSQTAISLSQFGSSWISQFFSVINTDRGAGSTLAPCAHLDSFASQRFQTLNTGSNWEIVHYGYSDDLTRTYGGTAGSYAEEYFYPDTPTYRSPSGFASYLQSNAPGHWADLVNPLYRFFGVYSGTGPILLFPRNCAPGEFSAGINQTQVASGCSYQKVSGTWFIVELAATCV